ncbi:acyltransferase family protein [Bradyrhizobium sp. CCBAU 53415]|uniref:acyltransferase family protein n=1 Tax=Bradyrhizobium sp. CCBAU 53415 TaxID=1325119 RepID=UPI00230621C9|nr:acyltransferase family protein [Bradyrhizobium sp. CCBAU 53415]
MFIGLISYPLYLWHWPLLSFVRIVESGNPAHKFIAAAVGLSFPLAWLTYRFVEQPIRNGFQAHQKVLELSMAMASIAIIGLGLFFNEGADQASSIATLDTKWLDAKLTCDGLVQSHAPNNRCIASIIQDDAPIDLVIGDSHAFAFASGLIRPGIVPKNTFLISLAGCPPFLSVDRYEDGIKRYCDFASIIDKIRHGRSINRLILIGRYAFYASGDGYGSDGGLKPGTVAISRPGRTGGSYIEILVSGLEATLRTLRAARTILVLQAPELGFDIKSCEDSRPVRLSSHVRVPCAISRRDVEDRQSIYRPAFNAVLKDFSAVEVIDPMQHLCDRDLCYGAKDALVLYTDDNHVSPDGAAEVFLGFH